MTATMSKAERILALLDLGLSTGDIASIIGCNSAYVRVVRQRAASPDGLTPSDRAWRDRNPDKVREMHNRAQKLRYDTKPEARAKQRETNRLHYRKRAADPVWAEQNNAKKREHYRAKREEINAQRRAWRAERRAIVAAMVEVANAKA